MMPATAPRSVTTGIRLPETEREFRRVPRYAGFFSRSKPKSMGRPSWMTFSTRWENLRRKPSVSALGIDDTAEA